MVRIFCKWARVARADDPVAYSRQIMMNVFLAGRARRWHGEIPHARLPEADTEEGMGQVEARDELRRVLLMLPRRQRAAVVLRRYEQRSEAETAVALGCSVGNVKSLASRGLVRLRSAIADERQMEAP